MKRAAVLCLVVLTLACANSTTLASVISVQGGPVVTLLPNTAGQQVTLWLSGSDPYFDTDLRTTINGGVGPAPRISAIFGIPSFYIYDASLAGSIWSGGGGGIIGSFPNGTSDEAAANGWEDIEGSTGLQTSATFSTQSSIARNTAGVYAIFNITTVGVPVGDYTLSLAGTQLFNYVEVEELDFQRVPVPLQLAPITLSIVPEPSAYALVAIGLIGLLAFRRWKR